MMKKIMMVGLTLGSMLGAGCRFGGPPPDGSGTIECTQVEVAPLVAGRILELLVEEGGVVTQGQVLARLDSRDFELRRDEAKAAHGVAQAHLDLMLAGSRSEDVRRAEAQVREAQAAAEAAAHDFQRVEQVHAQKSATDKQRDDAKAMAERTAAALAAAQEQLARLVQGNREQEIRGAQASVEQAAARVAQLEKAVADGVVTAPRAGTVTVKVREAGEYVNAGLPLVTLSRLDEVWLSLYIPEDRLSRVKLGAPVKVKLDGDPADYRGTISFVSPEAEFTPRNAQTPDERAKLVYRVKVVLPNPDGVFKPGMPADGYLEVAP